MTVMPPEIQWYIARDGKQYGPLSDAEMGLFMRGGHLKPADLVWRPGFSDWLPAVVAFPTLGQAATQLPHPGSAKPPPPASSPPAEQASRSGATPASDHNASSQPSGAGGGYTQQSPTARGNGPAASGQPGLQPQPAVQHGATHSSQPKTQSPNTQGKGQTGDPSSVRPSGGRSIVSVEQGYPQDDAQSDGRGRHSLGRMAAIAAALLVVAGGGWLTYANREAVKKVVSSFVAGGSGSARNVDASIPAFVAEGATADAIDARFQKTPLWSVVKRGFPEWYGEQLLATTKLKADNKPDATITKHLLEALVALRRKHANDALAASTPKLVSIASAFLGNLKKISAQNTATCYSFISQGETSPAIIDLLQQPGAETGLQAQVTAVFEAIADGRKSPVKHASPEKADYDALAEQLTKIGWSQADLQLFADPRALARTSHERVCKMVQDWFGAHIAVKDSGAQERLLIETLRPVVAG